MPDQLRAAQHGRRLLRRVATGNGDLFGWEFDAPSPVALEVSEPESYGFLDWDGTGIRGGVGGGPLPVPVAAPA